MYLLHSYKETVSVLDSEGRSYHIPPNTPYEVPEIRGTDIPGMEGSPAYKEFFIPAAKVAEMLKKKAVHYGLVTVFEIRTPGGISFDVEGAKKASDVARHQAEDLMMNDYVKAAKEDELKKLPVKPPSAPIVRILNERGLDLKRDFGITPVGWTVSEGAKQRDEELSRLSAQNTEQAKEIADLKTMISRVLEMQEKKQKA